ncbi:MAG: class I SAM-dependent methyltransferase [Ignavibacteriales bacterium]
MQRLNQVLEFWTLQQVGIMDAEIIDLLPSTFDAALCKWGLMLLPDPKAGLSNINKSLVNGGHFAAAVWSSPSSYP